jgi:response regulator NasT
MKLVLIAERQGASSDYIRAGQAAGWELVSELDLSRADAALADVTADAAVLISRRVDDRVLCTVRAINSRRPMPVVLFTEDSLQPSIRAAVSAGVSAYVVNCADSSRLASLLEVAVIRFTESQQLKNELHKAKTSLAERSTVEKAKGIIMRQRDISEEAAYQLLRKLAMDRNRRIGEVASDVIAAARVLI